jgi:hypothetical protein
MRNISKAAFWASEIKEKVTETVKKILESEKAKSFLTYMQAAKIRVCSFFSKLIYVVFVLSISLALTLLSYPDPSTINGLAMAAQMGGINTIWVHGAPYVLTGLIWYFTYRVIKKRLAREPAEIAGCTC